MIEFGLVTEGITDQIVIENILLGYFDNPDIIFDELQPLRDATDENRSTTYAGWTKVFEYCKSSKFREALPFKDYIIIQIDTDVAQDYGISRPETLTVEEVIEKVIDKFKGLIGEKFYEEYCKDKIIFAIAVYSIECWLLPLYESRANLKAETKNCLDRLNQKLKKGKFTIDPKNKNIKYYRDISKKYHKHRILMKHYKENPSLKIFIEEIEKRKIVIEIDEF